MRAAADRRPPPVLNPVLASEMVRQLQRLVEVRWYPDWRWRFTSDGAGVAVWCGRMGIFLWRER